MASFPTIEWAGFSRGEDSASAVVDPTSLANGYCAILENVEPGSGRLKPRLGSRKVSQPKDIWWMGEYQKASGGYCLSVDSGDLVSTSQAGATRVLVPKWLNEPAQISTVRVGKYLILLTDLPGASLVIQEKSSSLSAFSAYIQNETQAIMSAVATVDYMKGGESHYFSDEEGSRLPAPPTPTGGFDASAPRNLTFTWIRLEDASNRLFQFSTDGMPGAQLESWEDVSNRVTISYPKIFVNGTGTQGFMGDLKMTFNPLAAPENATHLRLYMTLTGTVANGDYDQAQAIADGLVYRWIADIPVGLLGSEFVLGGTDGGLAGSVNLAWSTGRDDLPPGGSIKFFDGRLWVYGGKSESNPGRSYHSAVIDGSTEQLSKLLSFRYDTDFKDTSTDETEPGVGMAISHGQLIFFNTRSVYALQGTDYSPEVIDMTRGAVGGITEIGQRAFYLSQEGPAVVSGTTVDGLDNFKSDMVRPGIALYSAFFETGKTIRGMWHNDSWMLTDGQRVACYLMRGNADGTWRLKPGEPMSFAYSCSPKKGELWVGGGSFPIYSLMDKDRVKDGSTPFTAKLATNGTPVPKSMISGEALRIWTWTRWTDKSQLKIALVGDHGRLADLYQFEETLEPGASAGHAQGQRGEVLQIVRQGAMSHWFQVELEKNIWNSDVLMGPIRLELIARNWHPESISLSDPGRAEPILDAGFITWDPETTEI